MSCVINTNSACNRAILFNTSVLAIMYLHGVIEIEIIMSFFDEEETTIFRAFLY